MFGGNSFKIIKKKYKYCEHNTSQGVFGAVDDVCIGFSCRKSSSSANNRGCATLYDTY